LVLAPRCDLGTAVAVLATSRCAATQGSRPAFVLARASGPVRAAGCVRGCRGEGDVEPGSAESRAGVLNTGEPLLTRLAVSLLGTATLASAQRRGASPDVIVASIPSVARLLLLA
jgi:hypothetical protein